MTNGCPSSAFGMSDRGVLIPGHALFLVCAHRRLGLYQEAKQGSGCLWVHEMSWVGRWTAAPVSQLDADHGEAARKTMMRPWDSMLDVQEQQEKKLGDEEGEEAVLELARKREQQAKLPRSSCWEAV